MRHKTGQSPGSAKKFLTGKKILVLVCDSTLERSCESEFASKKNWIELRERTRLHTKDGIVIRKTFIF